MDKSSIETYCTQFNIGYVLAEYAPEAAKIIFETSKDFPAMEAFRDGFELFYLEHPHHRTADMEHHPAVPRKDWIERVNQGYALAMNSPDVGHIVADAVQENPSHQLQWLEHGLNTGFEEKARSFLPTWMKDAKENPDNADTRDRSRDKDKDMER